MATIPVGVDENLGAGEESGKGIIRVILADTQAIFRAGLRKIFALEDDIRVVGQAETLAQAQTAVKKFSADVLVFESALAPNPVEAVASFVSQSPTVRVVVVTPTSRDEELTLELFRRGAHGICRVKWSLRLWWTACAKLPRARTGSTAKEPTG